MNCKRVGGTVNTGYFKGLWTLLTNNSKKKLKVEFMGTTFFLTVPKDQNQGK